MVWCGEIMCDIGFQEVIASVFFLSARPIDQVI